MSWSLPNRKYQIVLLSVSDSADFTRSEAGTDPSAISLTGIPDAA